MSSPEANFAAVPQWARVNAGLTETATIRQCPEDFRVDEQLPFEPSDTGEFALIRVQKTGSNTDWVARQLASFAEVAPRQVSYAGLKDRHAVTRQWFSIHLPGKKSPDWTSLRSPDYQVLEAFRHQRKLRRGALSGNRFRIRLREIDGPVEVLVQRCQSIQAQGVPNYFGRQRFGQNGSNIERAHRYYRDQIGKPRRFEMGLLHSAARAWLFNQLLSQRVAEDNWNQILAGDVFSLDGSGSIFGPEPCSEDLLHRMASGDIHPTGPLWGKGQLASSEKARALELSAVAGNQELVDGLIKAGLAQQRRSLRLPVRDLEWQVEGQDLVLEFFLDRGCFATSVLRELACFQ